MKIDSSEARSLVAVIEGNLAILEERNRALDALAQKTWQERDLIVVGYHLPNLYSAIENSFDQISRSFENHVVDQAHWHRELMSKMFLDLSPLRPAVMSAGVRPILHEMLAFRHVFRNNYEIDLDPEKLQGLMQRWQRDREAVAENFRRFAVQLGRIAAD